MSLLHRSVTSIPAWQWSAAYQLDVASGSNARAQLIRRERKNRGRAIGRQIRRSEVQYGRIDLTNAPNELFRIQGIALLFEIGFPQIGPQQGIAGIQAGRHSIRGFSLGGFCDSRHGQSVPKNGIIRAASR